MAAPKDAGEPRLTLDSEVDFAGYDPYIVALTAGVSTDASASESTRERQATESRKVKLMTWLREHRA